MVAKSVFSIGGVLFFLPLVYLRLMEGYGITDCGIKCEECPVGRGLSADLAVVMTEYGCSSVPYACDF